MTVEFAPVWVYCNQCGKFRIELHPKEPTWLRNNTPKSKKRKLQRRPSLRNAWKNRTKRTQRSKIIALLCLRYKSAVNCGFVPVQVTQNGDQVIKVDPRTCQVASNAGVSPLKVPPEPSRSSSTAPTNFPT